MGRLRFTKEGVAVWSSHLDLMRALMRCFRRAGIDLKHSQGFTPHPELSILMPLSVGVESQCELAEFTLAEGCPVPIKEVAARMAPVLPAGLRALESYEGGKKAGKLAWLRARLTLTYDGGVPADAEAALTALFARPSLVVEKFGKKGPTEMDIAPMLRDLSVLQTPENAGDGFLASLEILRLSVNSYGIAHIKKVPPASKLAWDFLLSALPQIMSSLRELRRSACFL